MGVEKRLIPMLRENDMLLPDELYAKAKEIGQEQKDQLVLLSDPAISSPLLEVSDFNSLIARSQEHAVPIFSLNDDQLKQSGSILATTKKSMEKFRALFSDGADRLIALTENAESD